MYKNENVGAVDVVIDPTNSNVVYAGLWNTRRPPWYTYAPTNGPGGGIFKSTDGGTTWKQLTTGLPPEGIGRTGIAVSPSNPRRVYAVVDCLVPDPNAPPPPAGGGWRSRRRWRQARPGRAASSAPTTPARRGRRCRRDQALWGRGWYFEKLAVDPKNPDIVYVPNVAVSRTKDGGKTWVALRGSPGGDDYHQAWVSPDDSNTMIVASDQGAIITRNAKTDDATRRHVELVAQPADGADLSRLGRLPLPVLGDRRAAGLAAPSRCAARGKFAEISMRDWEPIGAGGESGMTAGDPLHPGIIFGGTGQRFDLETNAPIAGHDERRVARATIAATGRSRSCSRRPIRARSTTRVSILYKIDRLGARRGRSISADLTRPDPGVPPNLDARRGSTRDRNGKRGVIYAVAPSPLLVPMLWVGTDDGLIHVTTNDGKTWQNVTPPARHAVEPRHDDRGVALRLQRGVRERRPAPAAGLRAVHLSHARHGQDVAEDHERVCPPASTSTS